MTTENRPANRKATASFLTDAQYIAADLAHACDTLEQAQKVAKNALTAAESRREGNKERYAAWRRAERRFHDSPATAHKALDLTLDLLAAHPKYQAQEPTPPTPPGMVEVDVKVGEEPAEDAGDEEQEG